MQRHRCLAIMSGLMGSVFKKPKRLSQSSEPLYLEPPDWIFESTGAKNTEAFGPGASREAIRARIKGATLSRSRTVLLIAGNLRDLREAWAVLGHEVLAHHGRNLFPPEIKKQILERIAASRGRPGMDTFSPGRTRRTRSLRHAAGRGGLHERLEGVSARREPLATGIVTPNLSIERTAKLLRSLSAAHVARYPDRWMIHRWSSSF